MSYKIIKKIAINRMDVNRYYLLCISFCFEI